MKIFALILFNLTSALAGASYQTFIHQGLELRHYQLPAIVVIESYSGAGCTGEVIGPKVVMTAAHCCNAGYDAPKGLGRVEKIEVHPHFTGESKFAPFRGLALPEIFVLPHDLCLIKLEKPIQNISPLSISFERADLSQKFLIIGAGDPRPGIRQYGEMEVNKISPRGLQASGKINYGRPGDSGGALLQISENHEVILRGVSSVSSHMCPDSGVLAKREGGFECTQVQPPNTPDILISAHTTGFVSFEDPLNQKFFKSFISDYAVEICGINLECPPVTFDF